MLSPSLGFQLWLSRLSEECVPADDADFVSLAKKHNFTAAHFGLLLGLLHQMEGELAFRLFLTCEHRNSWQTAEQITDWLHA